MPTPSRWLYLMRQYYVRSVCSHNNILLLVVSAASVSCSVGGHNNILLLVVSTLSCSYRSNAEYLQELVPEARVVKGFNVLSAYALENGGLQGSKEASIFCGVLPK